MRSKISSNSEVSEHKTLTTKDYQISYFSLKAYLDKEENEDTIGIASNGNTLMVAVADGAGGHPQGAKASDVAVSELLDLFHSNQHHHFLWYIEKANQKVRELKTGSKTTLSVGSFNNDVFRCHNIGDSEIIYWNSKGKEIYSTIPQSETGYLVESGIINQTQSLNHPNRNYVNHFLGDEILRIESSSSIKMKKGHIVLIGSDGLFDNLSHNQIKDIIFDKDPQGGINKLIEICIQQDPESWNKADDITFCIIKKL